jgi:hypothetical protein
MANTNGGYGVVAVGSAVGRAAECHSCTRQDIKVYNSEANLYNDDDTVIIGYLFPECEDCASGDKEHCPYAD